VGNGQGGAFTRSYQQPAYDVLTNEPLRRYDAAKHIKLDCALVVGYAKALSTYLDKTGKDEASFIREVCTSKDMARDWRWNSLWVGGDYAPLKNEGGTIDIPFKHVIDYKEVGEFDWDSIMIYGNDRALRRVDNGEFNKENAVPSPGDIAAVKKLYPDLPLFPPIPTRSPPPPPPTRSPPQPPPTRAPPPPPQQEKFSDPHTNLSNKHKFVTVC
jgi:hypothetical protein